MGYHVKVSAYPLRAILLGITNTSNRFDQGQLLHVLWILSEELKKL